MDYLSDQLLVRSGWRAFARTMCFVLFALLINLIWINGTFADSDVSLNVPLSERTVSITQSGQKSVKPCHHRQIRIGEHNAGSQTGASLVAGTSDLQCCADGGCHHGMSTALRLKRDQEFLAGPQKRDRIFHIGVTTVAPKFCFGSCVLTLPDNQPIGLLGARAEFVLTVRLLT